MSGPAIRLVGAVALSGGYPVLAGVDLEVARGEVVALAGANGAGKTSLLRACAGLLPVVAGHAEVLGADLVADPRAVRRRVGLLGHATGLYDDLRVREHLLFWLRASGRRGADAERSVDAALSALGLTGRIAGTPVGRLSAGQRRRVALAVLVARAPEVWLLDEPHAGLDAEHRDVLDGIVASAAAGGATIVLASHELDRAAAVAGRTVTVAGGVVVPAPAVVGGASHVA